MIDVKEDFTVVHTITFSHHLNQHCFVKVYFNSTADIRELFGFSFDQSMNGIFADAGELSPARGGGFLTC